jgi:hypothetical protein
MTVKQIENFNDNIERWKEKSQLSFRDRCIKGVALTAFVLLSATIIGLSVNAYFFTQATATAIKIIPRGDYDIWAMLLGGLATSATTSAMSMKKSLAVFGGGMGVAFLVGTLAYACFVCDWKKYNKEFEARTLCQNLQKAELKNILPLCDKLEKYGFISSAMANKLRAFNIRSESIESLKRLPIQDIRIEENALNSTTLKEELIKELPF